MKPHPAPKFHTVRARNGRFAPRAPARNPNGELILPREYWDRRNQRQAREN